MKQKVSEICFKTLVNFLRLSFFPEISCSICHFYLVRVGPSHLFRKFASSKIHQMVASLQNNLSLLVFDCLSSTKTLGSDFWKLWTGCCEFPVGIHPVFINLHDKKFASFSYHSKIMFELVR